MEASSFEFDPVTISVKAGERIRLTITSTDIYHTFTLPELGVDVPISGGQTKTVEFVADKTGTFTFVCKPHEGLGMKGTLEVSG